MQINTKTVELRTLKADENMVLTDGETFSSVGGVVYLGVNDSPENWKEVTEAEAEEMKKAIEEQQAAAEEQIEEQ